MSDRDHRIALSVVLAIIALLVFIQIFCQHLQVFYEKAHGSLIDLWRFLWMIPYVFIGLSVRAFRWRNYPGLPWTKYLEYLIGVLAASFLFFTAAHTFLGINNWLFYPSSAIIAIWFGFVPGRASKTIEALSGAKSK
jgi:hypothetical protein